MARIPDSEQIREKLKKAPENIRSFIMSNEFVTAFENIRTSHKLHFDEASKLSDALGAVFLEMIPMEEFPTLVQESLSNNKSAYGAVLREVNQNIFTVFRKTLEAPEIQQDAVRVPTPLEVTIPSSIPTTPSLVTPSDSNTKIVVDVLNEEGGAPIKPTYRSKNDPYREIVE